MPGPIPKRSSQRRRRNRDGPAVERLPASGGPAAEFPPADPELHPIARDWYDSLRDSGQAQYYEPSDVATARYMAEAMSRNLNAGKFSAQLFQAVLGGMTELLTTEGSRRKARMELERASGSGDENADAAITAIHDYRKRLGGDG